MKRAARSSFFRFLSLALGVQFAIAPLAQALDNNMINTMATTAQSLSGTMQQMIQMKQQQQMAQQMAQGLQTFKAQQVPPNQVAVPIFAGCAVFMAETNRPPVGQRCEGPPDPGMLTYYSELLNVATFNIETYGMYSIKGNAKTSQGSRCLDDAETQFKALLESRLAEVDKLTEKLNTDLMVFQKTNEPLVNNIKKGNALLFGTPADLLKDTKFDTKFADAQCASMIDGTKINELAKGGYKAINESIKKQADAKNGDGFNAKSFVAQASNIKRDIQNVANQLSKKASSMSPELLLGPNGKKVLEDSIKSKYNIKSFPGFAEAIGRQSAQLMEAQGNIGSIVNSMEKSEAQALEKNLLDPTMNTAQIVKNYKNLSSTSCVQKVFESRFNGIDNFVSLLENPSISKKMNKEADNELKNSLPAILSNSNLSMQEKLDAIKGISGVKNYKFKAQRTESVNGVSLSSGGYIKVDDLFKNIIIQDCEKLANSNNENGETPNNIVSRISEYHSELRQTYQSFPSKLKADLQEELLTCPDDTSVGAAGTCNSEAFNPTSKANSFCLRTASTCASNMLACADKAQKIFDTTRNEQLNLAKTYKTNLDATKNSLMASYMGIKTVLEQKARALDTMFPGQVFGVVTDEELNLKTDSKALVQEIDPSLQIEDPEQYVAQMKENLKKVRKKIEEQNKAIAKKVEEEKKSIIKNAGEQKEAWLEIANSCNRLINQYNDGENQRVSKLNEDAAKQAQEVSEFCAEARKMSKCPTEGEVDSLNSTMGQIAAYLQPGDFTAYNNYKEMSQLCYSNGNEGGNRFLASTNENIEQFPGAKEVCSKGELSKQPECTVFLSIKDESCDNPEITVSQQNECKTYATYEEEGSNGVVKRIDPDKQDDCEKKIRTKLTNKCIAENNTKRAEAEKEVAKLFKEYQGLKIAETMGQQSFPSCNATANGEVGKSFGDAARDIAGAMQENSMIQQQ